MIQRDYDAPTKLLIAKYRAQHAHARAERFAEYNAERAERIARASAASAPRAEHDPARAADQRAMDAAMDPTPLRAVVSRHGTQRQFGFAPTAAPAPKRRPAAAPIPTRRSAPRDPARDPELEAERARMDLAMGTGVAQPAVRREGRTSVTFDARAVKKAG